MLNDLICDHHLYQLITLKEVRLYHQAHGDNLSRRGFLA